MFIAQATASSSAKKFGASTFLRLNFTRKDFSQLTFSKIHFFPSTLFSFCHFPERSFPYYLVPNKHIQGALTEGDGSVQLTSSLSLIAL
jgi:hypothetical protein